MITTMSVIGTGLIGTSIALAATRQGVTVYLADSDEAHVHEAAALGAGRPERSPEPVDLAVIAVPPSRVARVLVEQQAQRTAVCYTDVASVKYGPERDVLRYAPEPFRYVGGHPLAGGERSGPLAGRADLFRDQTWVLTPSAQTTAAAVERGLQLIALCGAAPMLMDSRAHDHRVALTSHLPHVVASLTAARLRSCPAEVAALVGKGFRDTTRIARGRTPLWSDILRSNAAPIAAVLGDLQEDLTLLLAALHQLAGDDDEFDEDDPALAAGIGTIADLLDRGIAGLAEIPGSEPDPDALWVAAVAGGAGGVPDDGSEVSEHETDRAAVS
jgi:prephenate dehydrogenase